MEKDWLAVGWKHLVVRGVLGIIFGILAMAWPLTTVIALAFLWGCWALVDGVSSIWQAFQPEARSRVWLVVMGVLALLAAFFAIARPAVTAVALTWILGIWLIVRGVFELVGAFASTVSTPRWLLVLGGIFSLLLGFLFTANPGTGRWPSRSGSACSPSPGGQRSSQSVSWFGVRRAPAHTTVLQLLPRRLPRDRRLTPT